MMLGCWQEVSCSVVVVVVVSVVVVVVFAEGCTDPVRLTVRSTLCVLAKRRGRVSNKERFRAAHCRRKRCFLALKLNISLNIDFVIDVVAVLF